MIPIGTFVLVRDFGAFPGSVVEHEPAITLQGLDVRPIGWIKVRLTDGREWNGEPKLCDVLDPSLIVAAPLMLAALKSAEVAALELCHGQNRENQCWVTLTEIRDAIKLAEDGA